MCDWSKLSYVTPSRLQTPASSLTAAHNPKLSSTERLPPPSAPSSVPGSHDFSGNVQRRRVHLLRGGQSPGRGRAAEDPRPGALSAASVQRGGAHVRMEDGGSPPGLQRLQAWLRGHSGCGLTLSVSGDAIPSRRQPEEHRASLPGEVRGVGVGRLRSLGPEEHLFQAAS